MKRKDYTKPTMKVVKLQHHCHILSASDPLEQQGQKQQYESEEW